MCLNSQAGVSYSPWVTFLCYLAARVALGVLTAASLMMFEGAVMATIQELGGDYGIQRFVGNFGAIVFAPLGGYLIDMGENGDNFAAAVYIYLALKLAAAALILCIKLDFRPPGERILQNLRAVAKNTEVMVFLAQMMFAGAFWGFIEGFLFWFLDDLGASKLLMGWTVAVGMVTSLPFLIFSGPITDLVGHINVIVVGMLAYAIRLLGYSFLKDPIYVYPYEALEGFTMALMMTSAVTYVAKISSPRTVASVMGLMGALFFGAGKGTGCLIGGLIMDRVGAVVAFRIFSGAAVACGVSYLIFQCTYVRERNSRKKPIKEEKDLEKEQDKKDDDQQEEDKDKVYEDVALPEKVKPASPQQQQAPPKAPRERPIDVPEGGNNNQQQQQKRPTPSPPALGGSGPRSLTGGTRV